MLSVEKPMPALTTFDRDEKIGVQQTTSVARLAG